MAAKIDSKVFSPLPVADIRDHAKAIPDDSCVEGKLETFIVSGDICYCQIAVSCPACGKIEIIVREVPASLKKKLVSLLLKRIRIVHVGGKWGVNSNV
jgi:hypothetical protein